MNPETLKVVSNFEAHLSASPLRRNAVTTRWLDFWLLGGLSILVWFAMVIGNSLKGFSWAFDHHYNNIGAFFGTMVLFVNYPHFMATYRIAYGQGKFFIFKHWKSLLLLPALLLFTMIIGLYYYTLPMEKLTYYDGINSFFKWLGWPTRFGKNLNFGVELISYLIGLMYFTVGWHYTKQTYGCMMVYAHFDRYELTLFQKKLIKWNLFGLWASTYFNGQRSAELYDFFGLKYFTWGYPSYLLPLSVIFLFLSGILVVKQILFVNYRKDGRWPSIHFMIPFLAMYVWWLPLPISADFYILASPFFHCLQYLAFVFRLESARIENLGTPEPPRPTAHQGTRPLKYFRMSSELSKTLIPLGLILSGFAAFEFIPNAMDRLMGKSDIIDYGYAVLCAGLFINIHHYFLDHVIWRFDNKHIREQLL